MRTLSSATVVTATLLASVGSAQEVIIDNRVVELLDQLWEGRNQESAVEELMRIGEPAAPYLLDELLNAEAGRLPELAERDDPQIAERAMAALRQVRGR